MTSDLHTLVKEIDESEVKLAFANRCIKAQEDLSNKLKAEINRRKEIRDVKKNENIKLQAEIQNAEHEIKNLITTHSAIVSANTETKKELLMAKENNNILIERMNNGEKKYEDLWLQSKNRYEGIPYVQELLQSRKTLESLQVDIKVLDNEIKILDKEYDRKKDEVIEKERRQIIQLAQFVVREVPAIAKTIQEKNLEAEKLTKEIENIVREQKANRDKILGASTSKLNSQQSDHGNKVENWVTMNNKGEGTLMIPRLQLPSINLDISSVRLDIDKVGLQVAPVTRKTSIDENNLNRIKGRNDDNSLNNAYISCYFNKPEESVEKKNNEAADFSRRKLINIIDDIELDEIETNKIISKVNGNKLKDVTVIGADINQNDSNAKQIKTVPPIENMEIEEIDLTNPSSGNVIIPPTQFMDLTQDNNEIGYQQEVEVLVHITMEGSPQRDENKSQNKCLQDSAPKKRVSFDLPMSVEEITDEFGNDANAEVSGNQTIESIGSQLDMSEANDNFAAIKNMILKKHNLDLSPQFIYGKNTTLQNKIVKSKFFENVGRNDETDEVINISNKNREVNEEEINPTSDTTNNSQSVNNKKEDNTTSMEIENPVTIPKMTEEEKPVAGLLFMHGPQGIPDCLDISMSTTGYEEGDEFPTCLDSSLLLSPKADLPMTTENVEVGSQELPNFMSGFRKGGLSFFKQTGSDNNPDCGKQNQENNFSFHFGGEDKKSKGGIFSFFK